MKTAAKVLGIVGGALSIVASIVCIIFILLTGGLFGPSGVVDQAIQEAQEDFQNQDIPGAERFSEWIPKGVTGIYNFSMGLLITCAIIGFLGGAAGLVGGLLVDKNYVLAGVLMLVAGVLTFSGCITFICLVLGGIFALVKGKDNKSPAVV